MDRCGLKENKISLSVNAVDFHCSRWFIISTNNIYLTIAKRPDLKCYHHKDKYMRWWI